MSGSVRLINSLTKNANRGIVEVCVDETWSRVCNEGWDYRDATVICNQLGLPSYGKKRIISVK